MTQWMNEPETLKFFVTDNIYANKWMNEHKTIPWSYPYGKALTFAPSLFHITNLKQQL